MSMSENKQEDRKNEELKNVQKIKSASPQTTKNVRTKRQNVKSLQNNKNLQLVIDS